MDPNSKEKLFQILTPEGLLLKSKYTDLPELSDTHFLRRLYSDMRFSRRLDIEATSLQRQGELGLFPPALGQEAAQVGSAHAALVDDFIFPSYREHGVLVVRGVDPVKMLSVFRGVSHSGWDPKEKNTHFYTFVVGAHALHATGYAIANTLKGENSAVLAYFGDGATSQGDISEAMVFAVANSAPVVFFVQNNGWAISTETATQVKGGVAHRARGFGMEAVRVDGNDVLACFVTTRWALEEARSGRGPILIEAETYRMGPHTTSDDPSRYRSKEEEASWRLRDPIDRFQKFLSRKNIIDHTFEEALNLELEKFASDIRDRTKALTPPLPQELFSHVYSSPPEIPPLFTEMQKEWLFQGANDGN